MCKYDCALVQLNFRLFIIYSRIYYALVQRDPAFKKVDFKKVRHCFSEKTSSYKKVFSLRKYHFLIISLFMDHYIVMSYGQALPMSVH